MLSFQPRLNNQLSLSRKLHSVAFKGQQKARFAHTHLFVSDDAAPTPLPKHQWVGIDQKQHKEKYVWALIGLQWQRHHCIGCGVFIWCLSLHRSCKSCLTWKLSCQRWFTILIKKHTHTQLRKWNPAVFRKPVTLTSLLVLVQISALTSNPVLWPYSEFESLSQ